MHGLEDEVRALVEAEGQPVEVQPLAELLKGRREQTGLHLAVAARRACMSRSQLSSIEKWRSEKPGMRTIHALSYAYSIPFMTVLLSALFTQGCAPGAEAIPRDLQNARIAQMQRGNSRHRDK